MYRLEQFAILVKTARRRCFPSARLLHASGFAKLWRSWPPCKQGFEGEKIQTSIATAVREVLIWEFPTRLGRLVGNIDMKASKAQRKGDIRNYLLQDPYVHAVSWALIE